MVHAFAIVCAIGIMVGKQELVLSFSEYTQYALAMLFAAVATGIGCAQCTAIPGSRDYYAIRFAVISCGVASITNVAFAITAPYWPTTHWYPQYPLRSVLYLMVEFTISLPTILRLVTELVNYIKQVSELEAIVVRVP